jgi:hypothetical protein
LGVDRWLAETSYYCVRLGQDLRDGWVLTWMWGGGDLSRFIEEAVRAHILELTDEQVKTTNANVSEVDLTSMVDEALQWARKN